MTEFNRIVVLHLNFNCGLLFMHLNVDLDLGADESRLFYKCLLDADDFVLTLDLIDDGAIIFFMSEFDATSNQVALTYRLEYFGLRGLRFFSHDSFVFRLDTRSRLHTVVVNFHLHPVDFSFQIGVEVIQHVFNLCLALLHICSDKITQHAFEAFIRRV